MPTPTATRLRRGRSVVEVKTGVIITHGSIKLAIKDACVSTCTFSDCVIILMTVSLCVCKDECVCAYVYVCARVTPDIQLAEMKMLLTSN